MPESTNQQPVWIAIGSFDGVHLGHQALIRQLVDGARGDACQPVVVTFYPHPAVVLRGAEGPYYLTSPEERAELLRQLGVAEVITLPFTRELAQLTAVEFLEFLMKQKRLRVLMAGNDFALGRDRQGSMAVLAELGRQMGFEARPFQPVLLGDTVISSSTIRAFLANGDVESAAHMLGRRYTLAGLVVPGDGRGRTIGIPTVNIEFLPERLLPASGVYATWIQVGGQRYLSVSNIGVRPTFENQPVARRLETHILDLQADLYGQMVTLEFKKFLRSEMRFGSAQDLIDQIQQDIRQAREELSHDA